MKNDLERSRASRSEWSGVEQEYWYGERIADYNAQIRSDWSNKSRLDQAVWSKERRVEKRTVGEKIEQERGNDGN